MLQRAILAMQRDAAEVEHRQHVGVADFVLQAESEDIELGERRERFEAIERQVRLPQFLLEVDPGREGAFARPLRIVVHDRVEDLQAVVRHAKRVGIGKRQAQSAAHFGVVLDDAVEFAAEVLGRCLHAREDAHDGVFESGLPLSPRGRRTGVDGCISHEGYGTRNRAAMKGDFMAASREDSE